MTITRRSTSWKLPLPWSGRVSDLRSQAALAQAKPFEGKELKVLVVRSSQFQAQAKRVAAFTERTGIKVTFVEVPFPAMREKLTAELVGGSSDYDVFCPMDAWVPSLVGMLEPIEPRLAAQGHRPGALPERLRQRRHGRRQDLWRAGARERADAVLPPRPVREERVAASQDLGRGGAGRDASCRRRRTSPASRCTTAATTART